MQIQLHFRLRSRVILLKMIIQQFIFFSSIYIFQNLIQHTKANKKPLKGYIVNPSLTQIATINIKHSIVVKLVMIAVTLSSFALSFIIFTPLKLIIFSAPHFATVNYVYYTSIG